MEPYTVSTYLVHSFTSVYHMLCTIQISKILNNAIEIGMLNIGLLTNFYYLIFEQGARTMTIEITTFYSLVCCACFITCISYRIMHSNQSSYESQITTHLLDTCWLCIKVTFVESRFC